MNSSLNINTNLNAVKNTNFALPIETTTQPIKSHAQISIATNSPQATYSPAFKSSIRTKLTPEEEKKYNIIAKVINKQDRKNLEGLLKNGRLLSLDSNDKSTTLDNLFKIITTPRIQGISGETVLGNVIEELSNPHSITQKFEDVPQQVASQILANAKEFKIDPEQKNLQPGETPVAAVEITKDTLNVQSSSCVAASIQFNLAHKNPAEYARVAESLTSQEMCVEKTMKLKDISENPVDAIWLLKEFNVEHQQKSWNDINVKLRPDRNAIIRARMQASYQDPDERNIVDILMQSTFMNIGSQNTYNSLTDSRTGHLNSDASGLTDIEKNMAEVLVEGKNKISVTYQVMDENGKLIGYECELKTVLAHITEALKMGENVIIGYTHTDENNKVINGHEITITGIETDKNGEQVFVCNDTDDMLDHPIKYKVKELLPKIHHAGLPKAALKEDVQFVESWVDVIKQFKENKEQPAPAKTVA